MNMPTGFFSIHDTFFITCPVMTGIDYSWSGNARACEINLFHKIGGIISFKQVRRNYESGLLKNQSSAYALAVKGTKAVIDEVMLLNGMIIVPVYWKDHF